MPVSGLGSGGAESPPSTSTHKASPADTSAARNAEFLKALAERSDAERVAGGGTAGDSSSATDAASRGGRLTLPLHLYNASEDEVKLDREAARTFRDYSAIGAIGVSWALYVESRGSHDAPSAIEARAVSVAF